MTQASCEPVLQSSTEQWGMQFALPSAAVYCYWVTAHLYEEQISVGVIIIIIIIKSPVSRRSLLHSCMATQLVMRQEVSLFRCYVIIYYSYPGTVQDTRRSTLSASIFWHDMSPPVQATVPMEAIKVRGHTPFRLSNGKAQYPRTVGSACLVKCLHDPSARCVALTRLLDLRDACANSDVRNVLDNTQLVYAIAHRVYSSV